MESVGANRSGPPRTTIPSPTCPEREIARLMTPRAGREKPRAPMCNTHVHASASVPSPECLFSFLSSPLPQTPKLRGPILTQVPKVGRGWGEGSRKCLGISANNNIAYHKTKVKNGFFFFIIIEEKHDNVASSLLLPMQDPS